MVTNKGLPTHGMILVRFMEIDIMPFVASGVNRSFSRNPYLNRNNNRSHKLEY